MSSILRGINTNPINETAYEADLNDNEPRIVSGVYGAKSKAFRKKFKNQAAQDRFFDHPDREGNYEIQYVEKTTVSENRIIGHDANDPEVSVKGGAGSYNLSTLKKKATGEAEALLSDISAGKFKAAAYNVKQLENTLKTIAMAEEEMEKSYFGENAWNQLGQQRPSKNLPAPAKGSVPKHGRHFEEGEIVIPMSGPMAGKPHRVVHSQRTSIRIVPLGGNEYPGDIIGPRTKHEWVVPADMNEDYTGQFAAERTLETNPYGGMKDHQNRAALGEDKDPCWKNYKQVGMKKKNGKEVPNCVPKKNVNESDDGTVEVLYDYEGIVEEIRETMGMIANQFRKYASSKTSSVPAGPDSSKFSATKSYMINYVQNATLGGGRYSISRFYPVFMRVGGGLDLEIKEKIKEEFMDAFTEIVSAGLGKRHRNIQRIKTEDGAVLIFNELSGTNWGGFGYFVSKEPNKQTDINEDVVPDSKIMQKVEEVVANYFPDGDPIDGLGPWMERNGITMKNIDRVMRANGYDSFYAYWDMLLSSMDQEDMYEVADTRTQANKTGDVIKPEHDRAYSTLKSRAPRLYNFIRNEAPVPLDPVMTLQALQHMGNEGAVMRMIKKELAKDTEQMYDKNHPSLAESINRVLKKAVFEAKKSKKAKELEEEKKKGSNGKACWDGYRYAGTENGKDKCVPVKKPKKTKESTVIKGLKR